MGTTDFYLCICVSEKLNKKDYKYSRYLSHKLETDKLASLNTAIYTFLLSDKYWCSKITNSTRILKDFCLSTVVFTYFQIQIKIELRSASIKIHVSEWKTQIFLVCIYPETVIWLYWNFNIHQVARVYEANKSRGVKYFLHIFMLIFVSQINIKV